MPGWLLLEHVRDPSLFTLQVTAKEDSQSYLHPQQMGGSSLSSSVYGLIADLMRITGVLMVFSRNGYMNDELM